MAYESGEDKDIILALKQILNICIQDDAFDVDSLAMFDLEYMFLKLRSRSVSNIVSLTFKDVEDEKEYTFNVDLEEVEMLQAKEFDNKIMLSEDIGVIMKWPSIKIVDDLPTGKSAAEMVEYLIGKCIDKVFDADEVYPSSDYNETELQEFIESLDITSFNKVKSFFDNLPEMEYKIKYKNSMGHDREIILSTLSDFFTWG